jgi:nucleotide-binding universal stress UspA family protein
MFKRILIPTDGSKLSEIAVAKGIEFAKLLGASVYGFYVLPEYSVPVHGVDLAAYANTVASEERARPILATIQVKAHESQVKCECGFEVGNSPYQAIVAATRNHNCDLIFMASHGRRGMAGVLLGSETQKVLTHCHIPVLVYRGLDGDKPRNEQ